MEKFSDFAHETHELNENLRKSIFVFFVSFVGTILRSGNWG
jgi:hypothetical protein